MKKKLNFQTFSFAAVALVATVGVGLFLWIFFEIRKLASDLIPSASHINGIIVNCRSPQNIDIAQYCISVESNIISLSDSFPLIISSIISLLGLFISGWAANAAAKAASASIDAVKNAETEREISTRGVEAAEQLIVDNNLTAIKQLRAYIGPTTNHMSQIQVSMDVHGVVELKNYGQTPAHKVRQAARFGIMAADQHVSGIDLKEALELSPLTSVPPGGFIYIEKIFGRPFSDFEIQAINRGDIKLILRGRVEYEDIFGAEQYVDFCYVYEPLSQHPNHTALWREGNFAT